MSINRAENFDNFTHQFSVYPPRNRKKLPILTTSLSFKGGFTSDTAAMKFRAKMTDPLCMKHFANIISTIAKLSKSCVLRLCVDKMYFIVSDDSVVSRGPMVWCIIDQSHFFDYFKMEGVSPQENEIFLDFQADMLAKSLSSLKMSQPHNAEHVKYVKLKLTNKISPCLTFEIELPSFSHARLCVHDIPVEVIARRQWYNYEEPKLPTFDVSIDMPSLKLIRNIVDRMKTFSSHLNIKASNDGTYVLQVENDTVNIATTFKDLLVENLNDEEDDIVASARIDIKKFMVFLASEQLNPSKIVCNIVNDKLVHMFLSHEDLVLHYFLTAVVI